MSKYTIKNKAELVRRAEWHAKQDHIEQGTYGNVSINGKPKFTGCAIGCLAVPHTNKGLRAFVDNLLPGKGYREMWLRSGDLIRSLTKEFGIAPSLARVAEAVFESLPTHGAAISWVPQFARALPEGATITKRDVTKFLQEHGVDWSGDPRQHRRGDIEVYWEDVNDYGVDKFRREVVRWLRSLA